MTYGWRLNRSPLPRDLGNKPGGVHGYQERGPGWRACSHRSWQRYALSSGSHLAFARCADVVSPRQAHVSGNRAEHATRIGICRLLSFKTHSSVSQTSLHGLQMHLCERLVSTWLWQLCERASAATSKSALSTGMAIEVRGPHSVPARAHSMASKEHVLSGSGSSAAHAFWLIDEICLCCGPEPCSEFR